MERLHLLRDVEEGEWRGEDEGEKMTELKNGWPKDNERTGREEDGRDEAGGGMDRRATVREKHTLIN